MHSRDLYSRLLKAFYPSLPAYDGAAEKRFLHTCAANNLIQIRRLAPVLIVLHLLVAAVYLSPLSDAAPPNWSTEGTALQIGLALIVAAAAVLARRWRSQSLTVKTALTCAAYLAYLLGGALLAASDIRAGQAPSTYLLACLVAGLVVLLPSSLAAALGGLGLGAAVVSCFAVAASRTAAVSLSMDTLSFAALGWGLGRLRYTNEIRSFLLDQQVALQQAQLSEALADQRRYSSQLEQAKTELERLIQVDPLTGAASRRHLFEVGADWNGALLLFDIDHFKLVNDGLGHDTGDAVLRELVVRLQRTAPNGSLVARLGGEEFVVLVLVDEPREILAIAEHLRQQVAATPIGVAATPLVVTVSVGWAPLGGPARLDLDTALLLADEGLYAAKRAGRNQVGPAPKNRTRPISHSMGSSANLTA